MMAVRTDGLLGSDQTGVSEVVEPSVCSRSRDIGGFGDSATASGFRHYGLVHSTGVLVAKEVE